MASVLQPAFVAGSAGRLFVSCFAPPSGTDSWLLFAPPFAEEMNKSRRMMARLGHALAAHGIGFCVPDLYGTGDSEGDFGDATLATWERDLLDVAEWLYQEHGCRNLYIGGLRYGALLMAGLQSRLPRAAGMLLWQPLAKGLQQITQYLRLRQASGLTGGGGETLKELQARLAAGESVETAGYLLSAPLAQAIGQQDLAGMDPANEIPIHWLELSKDPDRPVTPVSAQVIERWRERGAQVNPQSVPGEPFWTTQELVDAPALVDASVDLMRAMVEA